MKSFFAALAVIFFASTSFASEQKPRLGKLAIIIDDIGYNIPQGKRAVALRAPITLSVLPHTPGAKSLATAGFASGKQIMLHIPMSNVQKKPLGPGALTSEMNKEEFLASLQKSIANIPHLSGVNNHMGSELTTQKQAMTWLMQELSKQNLFFIDSVTSPKSVAYRTAKEHGLISAQRDIFLDNDQDSKAIERQLLKAIRLAKSKGYAIAIGHPYKSTMDVLESYAGRFIDFDVLITPASAVALTDQ